MYNTIEIEVIAIRIEIRPKRKQILIKNYFSYDLNSSEQSPLTKDY